MRVTATALTNFDRVQADGSHYWPLLSPPAVLGIGGVGTLEDGTRVRFGAAKGAMAEYALNAREMCVALPDGLDDALATTAWNPGLASRLVLSWRVPLIGGETVLVMGATGVTGQMAIQWAKRFGAGRLVAAGRNPEMLERARELGADATVRLDRSEDALRDAFRVAAGEHGYDVVVDYVWGHPAEVLWSALVREEGMGSSVRVRHVQAGEMAGSDARLAGAVLRSANLEVLGMGTGAMPSVPEIMKGLDEMLALLVRGDLRLQVERVPLARVSEAWRRDQRGRRIVFIP